MTGDKHHLFLLGEKPRKYFEIRFYPATTTKILKLSDLEHGAARIIVASSARSTRSIPKDSQEQESWQEEPQEHEYQQRQD